MILMIHLVFTTCSKVFKQSFSSLANWQIESLTSFRFGLKPVAFPLSSCEFVLHHGDDNHTSTETCNALVVLKL